MQCLFCKIAAGEIPAKKAYEDEEMLAFHDISPRAPLHLLIIPKLHIASLQEAQAEHAPLLGRMMVRTNALARDHGSPDGFRLIVNTGKVGRQEVYHLHMHLMGGQAPLGASASF
nr:Purine nucleoside phosphoramidase [Cupriavidus sp.]